jgi:hypothetical protein
MADGKDNFNELPKPTSVGPDISAQLQSDSRPPIPGKVADTTVTPTDSTPTTGDKKAATATDSKGYDFAVNSEAPGVQGRFAGSPQENLTQSQENIGQIYAKVTTPEGQAALNVAAQQMIEHFQTPGLDKVAQV